MVEAELLPGLMLALISVTGATTLVASPVQTQSPSEPSSSGDTGATGVGQVDRTDSFNVTEDGRRYTVDPDRLQLGCSGKDCIPSIDNPGFESASSADAWLQDSDLVMGLEVNGETRAYPLRILNRHEIVNDRVGGEPVAVTYCPLCRSGLTYSRRVGNRTLEFGVSGRLLNANLVMYDRQTDTFWSQVQGNALVGPLVPEALNLVPSSITEWGRWSEANPDTRVLSRSSGQGGPGAYTTDPYEGYEDSKKVGFGVDEVDDRLPSKELVYGVAVGGESKAYTEDAVERENLIEDEVGGVPVAVVENQASGTVTVLLRELNGTEIDLSLRNNTLVSSRGSWTPEGDPVSANQSLRTLNSHGFYWFAWSKFHPETLILDT